MKYLVEKYIVRKRWPNLFRNDDTYSSAERRKKRRSNRLFFFRPCDANHSCHWQCCEQHTRNKAHAAKTRPRWHIPENNVSNRDSYADATFILLRIVNWHSESEQLYPNSYSFERGRASLDPSVPIELIVCDAGPVNVVQTSHRYQRRALLVSGQTRLVSDFNELI